MWILSDFVAQKDDILHFACQSDASFKINSQHNAAHADPLSLGQDYETEAECIPELNLTGRQGCQVADSNLNMSVVSRSLCAVEGLLYILIKQMMHAVKEAKISTASACPSSWYIKAILSSHRWRHGCAENTKAPWPFIKHLEWMMVGYNEGRMVFDYYLEQ